MNQESKITIAAIEASPNSFDPSKLQWKVTTSQGAIAYAYQGQWNKDWAQGMEVRAIVDKKTSKKGSTYFNLRCPDDLKPAKYQNGNGNNGNGAVSGNNEDVIKAINKMNDDVNKLLSAVINLLNPSKPVDGPVVSAGNPHFDENEENELNPPPVGEDDIPF